MISLVFGYIGRNTSENVFLNDLMGVFLAFFIISIEKPIAELVGERGLKFSVPQLQQDANSIKSEFEMPQMERNSSDEEWDDSEEEKWADKCTFDHLSINIYKYIYIHICLLYPYTIYTSLDCIDGQKKKRR